MWKQDLTKDERILLGPGTYHPPVADELEPTVSSRVLLKGLGHISAKRVHAFLQNKSKNSKDDCVVYAWRAVHPEFRLCCDMRRWRFLREKLLLKSYHCDATWPPTVENNEYFGDERWTLCVMRSDALLSQKEMWWYYRETAKRDPLSGVRVVITCDSVHNTNHLPFMLDRCILMPELRQICFTEKERAADIENSISQIVRYSGKLRSLILGSGPKLVSSAPAAQCLCNENLVLAAQCKDVQSITVVNAGVTPKVTKALFNAKNLQHIQLVECTCATIQDVLVSQKLVSLRLHNCKTQFSVSPFLTVLPALKAVHFDTTSFSITNLSQLSTIAPNLTYLSLSVPSQTQTGISAIMFFKNLRELHIKQLENLGNGLAHLKSCEFLETLSIDSCGIVSDVSFLQSCTRLRTLNLSRISLENSPFSTIRSPTRIGSLSFCSSKRVSLENISSLFPALEELDVSSSDINATSFSDVSSYRRLNTLNISGCSDLTDFSFLNSCVALRHIDVTRSPIKYAEVRSFFRVHRLNCTMKVDIKVLSTELDAFRAFPRAIQATPFWENCLSTCARGRSTVYPGSVSLDRGFVDELDVCLAACQKCDSLFCCLNALKWSNMEPLQYFTKLKTIQFGNSVSPSDLQKILFPMNELTAIDASNTSLGECILSSLHFFPMLTKLDLSSCANLKSFNKLEQCAQLSKLRLTDTECLALEVLEYTRNCTRMNAIHVSPSACRDIGMILGHVYPVHLRSTSSDSVYKALLTAIHLPTVVMDSHFDSLVRSAVALCASQVNVHLDCSANGIEDLTRVVACFSAAAKQCTITGYTGTLSSFPMTSLVELHITSTMEVASLCLSSQTSNEVLRALSISYATPVSQTSKRPSTGNQIPKTLSVNRFSHLQYLYLNNIVELSFQLRLSALRLLRIVELTNMSVSYWMLMDIGTLPYLETLSLERCTGCNSLNGFTTSKTLKQLNVRHTGIQLISCLEDLHPSTTLEQLRIQTSQCSSMLLAMDAMKDKCSLGSYWLGVSSQWANDSQDVPLVIDATAMVQLHGFKLLFSEVRSLRIESPRHSLSESKSCLAHFVMLRNLEIVDTSDNFHLEFLKFCPLLETISISSLSGISSPSELKTVSPDGASSLALGVHTILQNCKQLLSCSLSGYNVTVNMPSVAVSLDGSPLREIHLERCSVRVYTSAFTGLQNLQIFDVRDCSLSSDVITQLINLQNLVTVNLEGSTGCATLYGLGTSSNLRNLNMKRTNMDLVGCAQNIHAAAPLEHFLIDTSHCAVILDFMESMGRASSLGDYWRGVLADRDSGKLSDTLDFDASACSQLRAFDSNLLQREHVCLGSRVRAFSKSLTILMPLYYLRTLEIFGEVRASQLSSLNLYTYLHTLFLRATAVHSHRGSIISKTTYADENVFKALFSSTSTLRTLHLERYSLPSTKYTPAELSSVEKLVHLHLDSCNLGSLPSDISKFVSLQTLEMKNMNVPHYVLTYVALLRNLRTLSVEGCTGFGSLAGLDSCSTLKNLDVRNTHISIESYVSGLSKNVSLELLRIQTTQCAQLLDAMLCLEDQNVFGSFWEDVVQDWRERKDDIPLAIPKASLDYICDLTRNFSTVTRIRVDSRLLERNPDHSLPSVFQNIEEVEITASNAGMNVGCFSKFQKLRTVSLHVSVNPEKILRTLCRHQSLETLSIYTNGCTGSLTPLQQYPKLKNLAIYNATITRTCLEEINGIQGLVSLSLIECTVPSPIPELYSSVILESLTLRSCICGTGDAIQLAVVFPSLENLDLTGCTGVGNIEPLVKCSNLRSLKVAGTDVTLTAVRSLWLRVALTDIIVKMSNCEEELCLMALNVVLLDPARFWHSAVYGAAISAIDQQMTLDESAILEFNQLCNVVLGTNENPIRSTSQ